MQSFLLVGAGGFIGANLRYLFSIGASSFGLVGFPWATLAVNALGGLAIGVFSKSSFFGNASPQHLFIAVGVLGGFTTFSAFGIEAIQLLQESRVLAALIHVLANVLVVLLATWLGTLVRL